MQQTLWQRIKMWMCHTLVHKPDRDKMWVHAGDMHTYCKRCKKVLTATYDMMYGSTNWE